MIAKKVMFQFHTGSIKSLCATLFLRACAFQFHTGSIKRMLEHIALYREFSVSIPYWFD